MDRDFAVLIALGITPEGQRAILSVSVALSEAEEHWRAFFHSLLPTRPVRGHVHHQRRSPRRASPSLGPSPGYAARFHLQQNTQAYVPRLEQRAEVARAIRGVFDCPSRLAAEQRLKESMAHYAKTAPKLATWMGENLPQGFTVFTLPAAHRRLKHQRHRSVLRPDSRSSWVGGTPHGSRRTLRFSLPRHDRKPDLPASALLGNQEPRLNCHERRHV